MTTIPISSYDITLSFFAKRCREAYRFIDISIVINNFKETSQLLTYTLENQYDFNEKCPKCFVYMISHFELAFKAIMSELINKNITESQPLDIADLSHKTMEKMKLLENIKIGEIEQYNQKVLSEKNSLINCGKYSVMIKDDK